MSLGIVAVVGVAAGPAALDPPGAKRRIEIDEIEARAGQALRQREAVTEDHEIANGGRQAGLWYHATMEFGRWYPLAEAADHAPAGPGVFQLRLRTGLIDYPRGKSAMVRYGAADDVRAAVVALAGEVGAVDWLCRHLLGPTTGEEATALAARLSRDFAVRFGHPPSPP